MDGIQGRVTPPLEIELRRATPEDEPFLFSLFRELRAPEFVAAGLPPAALDGLLLMQFRAQTAGFGAEAPAVEDHVLVVGGVPAGRVVLRQYPHALHLVDISLASALRGKGVGTELMQQLIRRAEAQGLPMQLQVRSGNPAVRLYERLGFVTVADNGLDLIMQRPLSGP